MNAQWEATGTEERESECVRGKRERGAGVENIIGRSRRRGGAGGEYRAVCPSGPTNPRFEKMGSAFLAGRTVSGR